jgi:hypothetical protein
MTGIHEIANFNQQQCSTRFLHQCPHDCGESMLQGATCKAPVPSESATASKRWPCSSLVECSTVDPGKGRTHSHAVILQHTCLSRPACLSRRRTRFLPALASLHPATSFADPSRTPRASSQRLKRLVLRHGGDAERRGGSLDRFVEISEHCRSANDSEGRRAQASKSHNQVLPIRCCGRPECKLHIDCHHGQANARPCRPGRRATTAGREAGRIRSTVRGGRLRRRGRTHV